MAASPAIGHLKTTLRWYERGLRTVVLALALVSGLGLLVMMSVTCVDVILREFKRPLVGTYDIVKVACAITMACALPYTTAVKGHVAVEYVFHKLSFRGRVVVDTIVRLGSMALFGVLSYQSVLYGQALRRTGQVTATLQLPVFWVPYVIAFSCMVVILVILLNLLHPGREMIKP